MTILITGGCGYIGSVACEKLMKKNRIIIYDQKKHINQDTNPNLIYIQGNILNSYKLNKVFKQNNIDLVIHLAAKISVSESVRHPFKYYWNNVMGTKNLVRIMINNLCNNIIFTSSAAVYGDAIKMPINENDQLKPCNPYGTSKLKGEEIIQSSHLKYFIFRLFNVSGASDSYQHGVNNEKPQSLIAAVNKRIINHQSPIIYGNNYKTSDGTCSRDYVHVEDVSSAFQYVAQNIDNLSPGIFNLGSGKGSTVLEIVKLACKINKVPFTYEIQTNRAGDPNSLLADITLASSKLKWKPKHSLQDMITSDTRFRQKA